MDNFSAHFVDFAVQYIGEIDKLALRNSLVAVGGVLRPFRCSKPDVKLSPQPTVTPMMKVCPYIKSTSGRVKLRKSDKVPTIEQPPFACFATRNECRFLE